MALELEVWQAPIVDSEGNIQPGAQVTVFNSDDTIADIYSDLNRTEKPNPFIAGSDALARFYAEPGRYRVQAQVGSDIAVFDDVDLSQKALREDLSNPGSEVLIAGEPAKDVAALRSNLSDESDLALGSSLIRRNVVALNSLKDLGNPRLPRREDLRYDNMGFYSDSNVGGGSWKWNPNESKANHNGGTIVDPERIAAWDGTQGDLATLFTEGTGSGCFVRIFDGNLNVTWFGAVTGSADSTLSITRATTEGSELGFGVFFPSGYPGYSVNGSLNLEGLNVVWMGDGKSVIDFSFRNVNDVSCSLGSSLHVRNMELRGGGTVFDLPNGHCDIRIEGSRIYGFSRVLRMSGEGVSYSLYMSGNEISKIKYGDRDGAEDIFSNTNVTFSKVQILNNKFIGGGRHSCLLMSRPGNRGSQVIITGNVFEDYLLPGLTSNSDAQFIRTYADQVIISNNTFKDLNWTEGGASPTDVEAIYTQGATNIVISSNSFVDAGLAEGTLVFKSGSGRLIVSNNTFEITEQYRDRFLETGLVDACAIKPDSFTSLIIQGNVVKGYIHHFVQSSDDGNGNEILISNNYISECRFIDLFRFRNGNYDNLLITKNIIGSGCFTSRSILHYASGLKARIIENDFSRLENSGQSLFFDAGIAEYIHSQSNCYPKSQRVTGELKCDHLIFENDTFVQQSGGQLNFFGSGSPRILDVRGCSIYVFEVGSSNRIIGLPTSSSAEPAIYNIKLDMHLEGSDDEYHYMYRGEGVKGEGEAWSLSDTDLMSSGTGPIEALAPSQSTQNILIVRASNVIGLENGLINLDYLHKRKGFKFYGL